MNTILAVVGGGQTDGAVLATALDAARHLGAHAECLHVRISAGEAAIYTPHVSYAMGEGLRSALVHLEKDAATRSEAAFRHFTEACAVRSIAIGAPPGKNGEASAGWCEASGSGVERIIHRARFHDLAVVARPSGPNGMPPDLIVRLLAAAGRPVLVPSPVVRPAFETVMVCWKDTPEAARALGGAMSFLRRARRVVLFGMAEDGTGTVPSLSELAASLAWHGVDRVEIEQAAGTDMPVAEAIDRAAARCDADLVVLGAYGHSRTRELILGGCTQRFVEQSARPILFMH